jgi:hypothetical protein
MRCCISVVPMVLMRLFGHDSAQTLCDQPGVNTRIICCWYQVIAGSVNSARFQ